MYGVIRMLAKAVVWGALVPLFSWLWDTFLGQQQPARQEEPTGVAGGPSYAL